MTMTDARPPREAIELLQGEVGSLPVPEGRLVLESQVNQHGHAQSVAVLYPHGGKAAHELCRFSHGIDPAHVLQLALSALEAWR